MENESATITETKAPDRHDAETIEQVEELLNYRRQQMEAALAPTIQEVQRDLDVLSGMAFGSFEENKRFAQAIQSLVSDLNRKVVCVKDGCGQPALLRCNKSPTSPNGAFQCEHRKNGKGTRHSGRARLPRLKLVQANKEKAITTKTDTGKSGEDQGEETASTSS